MVGEGKGGSGDEEGSRSLVSSPASDWFGLEQVGGGGRRRRTFQVSNLLSLNLPYYYLFIY